MKKIIPLPELQGALHDLHAKYFSDAEAGVEGGALERSGGAHGPRAQAWIDRAAEPSEQLATEATARVQALLPSEAAWAKDDQDEYFGALYAIAKCKDEAFLQACTQSLANPSPFIVARACFVLGHAKETRAVPMLLQLLLSRNVMVLPDVIWALGMISDVRAVRPLHELWTRGMALETVAQALARLGYLDSLPYLVMGLTHPQTRVRLYTAGAMATIVSQHDPAEVRELWGALIPRVEPSLEDIFVPVRVLAACLLAQLGRPFSTLELRKLFEMRTEPMNPLQGFFTRSK